MTILVAFDKFPYILTQYLSKIFPIILPEWVDYARKRPASFRFDVGLCVRLL